MIQCPGQLEGRSESEGEGEHQKGINPAGRCAFRPNQQPHACEQTPRFVINGMAHTSEPWRSVSVTVGPSILAGAGCSSEMDCDLELEKTAGFRI